MGSVVAVLNMKGGTGKSTLATNLARGLQREGSACIVDADPQGTALRWANAGPEDLGLPPVVSASLPLNERILDAADGRKFTVVDGAAKAKDRTRQCVEVADAVLIPIRPSGADIWASEWLVSVVKGRQEATASGATATEASPSGKPAAAFVISQAIVGTNLAGEIEEVLERFELPVLDGRLSQRVAYAEALSLGKTVLDTAPSSKAATEVEQIIFDTLQLLTDTGT